MVNLVNLTRLFLILVSLYGNEGSIQSENHALRMNDYYEYCIVGAGPAGVQLAQHFHSTDSSSYILLERGKKVGNFFEKFPIHDQLISINKKYTGSSNQEFNLRHDWNSLLTSLGVSKGTDFTFTDFSDDYFPHKKDFLDYIGNYTSHFNLNVAYQSNVHMVRRSDENSDFVLDLHHINEKHELSCATLIWATGLGKPRSFANELYTNYDEAPVDPNFYKIKSVAIVGAGQTAFELAKAIYRKSASTKMLYR